MACYGQPYNICIGYVNAYGALREPDIITELVWWMLAQWEGSARLRPLWEKVREEELKEKLSSSRHPSTDGCLPTGNATGRMRDENQLREDENNEKE